MSNKVIRPPLRGLIFQGDRIVGGLDLPVPPEPFVKQFNREYAEIRLHVEIHNATRQHADPPLPESG
jgi:hypothetical protein